MTSTPNSSDADGDDDDRLGERDEQPHQDVRADQLPAPQRRRGQPLEDELLAVGDERDRGEDADLHDRQPEHARHEVADRVEVLGLDRLRARDDERRPAAEVDDAEDRPDRLVDRALELRPRRVGIDLDLGRRRRRPAGAPRAPRRSPPGTTMIAVDLAGLHLRHARPRGSCRRA